MKYSIIILLLVLRLAIPAISYGQYFQGLYDIDTSNDWGWDIFLQSDDSYVIFGTSAIPAIEHWVLFNMQISADGSTLTNKNLVLSNNFNLFEGIPGAKKKLSWGGYISPITEQNYYLTDSWAGLIKYNADGDVVFLKTYTDTPLYYDGMFTCAVMPDGGYIAGGQHALYTNGSPPMYLVRTDSLGDTLWTHTYQTDSTLEVEVNDIIPLADGRMVIGAVVFISKISGPPFYASYTYNTPWYIILDSTGNIISDTLYTVGFDDGAHIYADMNGGYVISGSIDTLLTADPADIQNFPCYIAHLDSNFRITWLTQFPYSDDSGHRQPWLIKQLEDSSYVVLGDKWTNGNPGNFGWAAKVNRNGEMIWSNSYQSDTLNDSHFRGAVETSNGNLVFVGESFNDTLPSWHQIEDVWLVGTDSNGCENGFCAPTAVPVIPAPTPSFAVFPNPTYGMLTATAAGGGTFYVYTIEGQQVGEYAISSGNTDITLPVALAPGIYMGVFKPAIGGKQSTVRLVYQP